MEEKPILAALRRENLNCDLPLDDDELCKIAASICRYQPNPRPNKREPLGEFLVSAAAKNNLQFFSRGKKWTPMFVFARLVKGRAEFAGMNGREAAERIEQELGSAWHELFSDVSDDSRAQFVSDFDAAHTGVGDGDALDEAWREALQFPVDLPHKISEKYGLFISLVAALQRRAGVGNAIPLPQERIAEFLGCNYTTVGRVYISYAVKVGFLRRTKSYVRCSKAAEYIYSGPGLSPEFLVRFPVSPESVLPEVDILTPDLPELTDGIGKSDSGKNAALAGLLLERKQELIGIPTARGGRVATFPHCPQCASYALYRRNDEGNYECETCGLQAIDEVTARRVR